MAFRTPDPWRVACLAAALGTALGAAGAFLQAASRPWRVGGFRSLDVAQGPAPRAETDGTTHAFGTSGLGTSGSHAFVVRNTGDAVLALRRGASSCSCTIGGFESPAGDGSDAPQIVAPGGETRVTVQWKGKGQPGPFRQQVTILTDDPRRPEIPFVVEGTLVPTWKAVPEAVVLPKLSTGAETSATTTIFTYGTAPPTVHAVVVDGTANVDGFSFTTHPLAADEVATETGATGGFRIDARIGPGLPLGTLRRTLVATFDMPERITAEIPIEGTVGGDLAVAGPGWDSDRQSLILGTVSGKAGLRTRLFLTAKGPHRDAVRPSLREVVPRSLEVTIGAAAPIGGGAVVRTPIDIVIPPGSRPANHLCSAQGPAGRIVIETGHPETPTLTIPVCVAIGP